MLGLIKKDLYTLSASMKIYIIMPILFGFLDYTNGNITMITFGTSFIAMLAVISSCAYDETSHFQDFALTLPVSRKDIVTSKFLMGNVFAVALFILCIILGNGMYMVFGITRFQDFVAIEFFQTLLVTAFVANVCTSIILTIMFKYGTEKGRIMFVMLFLCIGLLGGVISSMNLGISLEFLANVSDSMFLMVVAIISIVSEMICIQISKHIMEHKEI